MGADSRDIQILLICIVLGIINVVTFVIMWYEMFLMSVCYHMDRLLSCEVNVIMCVQMLSCEIMCYHVALSCDVIM